MRGALGAQGHGAFSTHPSTGSGITVWGPYNQYHFPRLVFLLLPAITVAVVLRTFRWAVRATQCTTGAQPLDHKAGTIKPADEKTVRTD